MTTPHLFSIALFAVAGIIGLVIILCEIWKREEV